MPTFRYVAKKGPGETIEGTFEAENRSAVLTYLAGQGFTPVQVTEAAAAPAPLSPSRPPSRPTGKPVRVPMRFLNQFTRQFASLVRSQVPILRALTILKDQTAHAGLRRVIEAMAEAIRQGQTLSETLAQYPALFSPLYVSLVRAGEMAGTLDTVMDRLADQAEHDEQLRAKVRGALAYPFFVGAVGLGTVIFLLTFVMPKILKLFDRFGGTLPWPTRLLMAASHALTQPWVWMVGLGFAAIGIALLRGQRERIASVVDRVNLRLPIIGPLLQRMELARFARAFGLLLDHGVPILRATDIAIPAVGHRVIRRQLQRLPAHLKEGGSVASCLKGLSIATPFVVNTIAVGEETGKIGEALMEVATFYERDLEQALQVAGALLEPAMILLVGGMVGFIVMAVLLPIFEMSSIVR